MYISQITLKNIRGFNSLNFNLQRAPNQYAGWTVFTGDNGSGKSTLLKAIAIGLVGRDTARSLQPTFQGWIREGSENLESSIQLEISRKVEDDDLTAGGKPPARLFPAKIVLAPGQKEPSLIAAAPSGKPAKYQTPDRTIWSTSSNGWFCCGYGPFRRIFGASSEAARKMGAQTTGRFVTMFDEAASLSEVDLWLRDLNYKKLENKTFETEQLDILMELLRDDVLPNNIKVERVDSDGLWLKDRNGANLSWDQMSDGYRSALALLADIIRHMINSYGVKGLTERDEDGKLRIIRSGVVLIDEIDAHLHPEWQRTIGFWLKKHFPNIQFLVSTHSPLVCQAADKNGLFVLPEPGSGYMPRALTDEERDKVVASRSDTILLGPAFGLENTRSPLAVESRAKYARLNAKKRAGKDLSPEENDQAIQLRLFAEDEEEG